MVQRNTGSGTSAGKPTRRQASKRAGNRVTLADVAAAAGVSVGAAGFVLNGRDDMRISAPTQERVRQAARDLNYRPNRAAQALRTGKTGTIAFLSDEIGSTPFAGAAIRGALEVARARHTTLFLVETLGDARVEEELIESLKTRDVDGYVYASMVTREAPLPAGLKDVPVVGLNTLLTDSQATAFIPDDEGGGFGAATDLLEAGHEQIVVLGDLVPEAHRPYAADKRLAGIERAHRQAGIEPLPPILIEGPEPMHGREAMQRYLESNPVPEALLCLNDRLAFGAIQALGPDVRPGTDISIVSFDNSDLATWQQPPLATHQLPYYDMGRRALTSLLDGDLTSGVQQLPMPLVRRDSIRIVS